MKVTLEIRMANAEGAPGGTLDGVAFCPAATSQAPMVAPTIPRDALVKNRLREFFNISPGFPAAPSSRVGNRRRLDARVLPRSRRSSLHIAFSVAAPRQVGQAFNRARSSRMSGRL